MIRKFFNSLKSFDFHNSLALLLLLPILKPRTLVRGLLLALIFLILGIFVYKDIFSYGICCDDILAIYNSQAYGAGKQLSYIFSPYGGQVIGVYLMFKNFGLNSQYYFITIFILKIISASSIYILAYIFSKSNLVAIASLLLYLFGYAGVGTSEYAHLSNIFLSIIILCLSLSLLINYHEKLSSIITLKSILMYIGILLILATSIIIAPVRVNGVILYLPIIELSLVLIKRSNVKIFFLRIILLVITVAVLKSTGTFGGSSPYHIEMIKYGLNQIFSSFVSLFKAIYYFAAIFFDIISPPLIDKLILTFINWLGVVFLFKYKFIYIFIFILFLIINNRFVIFAKSKFLYLSSFVFLMYLLGFNALFGSIFNEINSNSYPVGTTNYIFQTLNALMGGFYILTVTTLITIIFKKKYFPQALKTSIIFIWPFCFLASTFLFSTRTFVFETFLSYKIESQESYVHYYFIPAIGIYLSLSYLILEIYPLLTKREIEKRFLSISFFIITLLVFANALSVNNWVKQRMYIRSEKNLKIVSETINSEIYLSYKINRIPIIYFSKIDDGEYFYPYIVNEWGFSQFRYSIINNNYKITPYFVGNSIDDLSKILVNPKFSSERGIDPKININDVYAFEILNQNIVSKTDEFRKTLKKDSDKFNFSSSDNEHSQ